MRTRRLRPPTRVTFADVAHEWLEKAERGEVENRSGDRYKPSALRGYREALELRVLPELGDARLSTIERRDLQGLVNRLKPTVSRARSETLSCRCGRSTDTRSTSTASRSTRRRGSSSPPCGRAGTGSPTPRRETRSSLLFPRRTGPCGARRCTPGLRRGELMALDWSEVDLERKTLSVEASWDPKAGRVPPKSDKGRRTVPVPRDLLALLKAHKLRQGRGGQGLVFGRTADKPFHANTARRRAEAAWRRAGLEPIGLHECRHTYASTMIASGVNAKAIATYMGHSSIQITYDRYGHLMPGGEEEAAARLDAYLDLRRRASG